MAAIKSSKRAYEVNNSDAHHHRRRRKTEKPSVAVAEEDLFGKLPDEIIVSVLSRLEKIEHRASTSLVARRWRYLWKQATSTTLAFDSGQRYHGCDHTKEFVNRVDHVITSLSCCDDYSGDNNNVTIDGFNLIFPILDDDDLKYEGDIDRWLSFALQKKVKRINLDCGCIGSNYYSLTRNKLVLLDSLTSLCLFCVGVTGELLEYILTVAAPLLEELSVSWAGPSLVKFSVSGPSLKLKHLKVRSCWDLEHLYVHDVVNLESLHYGGSAKCLVVKDAPRIVKAITEVHFSEDDDTIDVPKMLNNLPAGHLEKLALTLNRFQTIRLFSEFPKLRNLKQLELVIGADASCCRLPSLLLDASPILRQLKIQFQFLKEDSSKEEDEEEEYKVGALSHPHKSLKVLEVIGFIGCQLDMGVVDYLIENTTSLEMIIVDTSHPYTYGPTDPGKQQAARELARTCLKRRLASGTKMMVL